MSISKEDLLCYVRASLREELLECYDEIVSNYSQGRWEPSELRGGKFCEVAYTIIKGYTDGNYPSKARKPQNFKSACEKFEQLPKADHPHSVRIQIPRVLISLYTIRNDRGVGHTGGDVNPNHMDAAAVLAMAKWVMAELVRIFHDVSVEEATEAIDAIVERTIPIVWEMDKTKRVLDPNLKYLDQVLLLLYGTPGEVAETELKDWIEHPRLADLRKDVLVPAHKARLIEYERDTGMVQLLPPGIAKVENELPLDLEG